MLTSFVRDDSKAKQALSQCPRIDPNDVVDQACKLAKLGIAVAAKLKPHHIGLYLCKGASTTEVLSRNELSSELFVNKIVFRSSFPVPVASPDTRTEGTVRGEVQQAHHAVQAAQADKALALKQSRDAMGQPGGSQT